MPPITKAIVVFDSSLGERRLDADALVGIDLTPVARDALDRAAQAGVELTMMLPETGTARFAGPLDTAGGKITVVGCGMLSVGSGALTVPVAKPGPTALVSEDRRLRAEARSAGLIPVPHVAALAAVAKGDALTGLAVYGARRRVETFAREHDLLPLWFQPEGETWLLIALGPVGAVAEAAGAGLSGQRLDYDPGTQDLVWLRVDARDAKAALPPHRIVLAGPERLLVALTTGDDAAALGVHGAHGHTEALLPDPSLLDPPVHGASVIVDPALAERLEPVVVADAARQMLSICRPPCATISAGYETVLDRYSGISDLDGTGPIASRHIAHPDNARAEAALVADLEAMGYSPWRHEFSINGRCYSNVIADLPGTGVLRIDPLILRRIQRRIASPILPRPLGPLPPRPPRPRPPVRGPIVGARALAADVMERKDSDSSEWEENAVFAALSGAGWMRWWDRRVRAAGFGAEVVVVGAHLDSTASDSPDATGPAPGRDDNASGLAAVLTMARYMASLRGLLRHTVRFCFFNAEEAGLVGSKAYARHLKSARAPVRGVFCMDMMGYNSDANRIFELHAGYTDPAIRDLGLPLAARVADAAAARGALAPAQIYRGTGYTGAPDRDIYDGAINRSDHAAFQQQGWGAVLASEDFFVNRAGEPPNDPNPNYHRTTDTVVDAAYAKDIMCAVTDAVCQTAL